VGTEFIRNLVPRRLARSSSALRWRPPAGRETWGSLAVELKLETLEQSIRLMHADRAITIETFISR
jgi:hypothetical protein